MNFTYLHKLNYYKNCQVSRSADGAPPPTRGERDRHVIEDEGAIHGAEDRALIPGASSPAPRAERCLLDAGQR